MIFKLFLEMSTIHKILNKTTSILYMLCLHIRYILIFIRVHIVLQINEKHLELKLNILLDILYLKK